METNTGLEQLKQAVNDIKENIGKVIIGQEETIELLLAAILAQGHVLIEGVPGVAKTMTAKLLAQSISVPFSRIQFTPDLMPSDVTGTSVFNPQTGQFDFRRGPIFSQIVLIDEINRSPAKTQAALFEVMEERQITFDGTRHVLPAPFIVLATQNPVEQEGTYRLPEAQLDRFLFKIEVGYPDLNEEVKILIQAQHNILTQYQDIVKPVITGAQIIELQKQVETVHVEEKVLQYIANIVCDTRENKALYLGASPRASIAVLRGSKAIAAMDGRNFVTPNDVQGVLQAVLAHRIILSPEKEMEGGTPKQVVKDIIQKIEVPV
ncbi:MAG: MoxR family ATPase [Niabella sp.]